MLVKDRIEIALNRWETKEDKLIAVVYYIGSHDAAKEVCDKHNAIVANMRARANNCRYHKLANSVIGDKSNDIIDHPDYSSDFIDWDTKELI